MQRRVLIIEDEKLIILSTQMVLEASGFSVSSAMNGEEGVVKARECAPDLILLDIMMPGIDGWETLTEGDSEFDLAVNLRHMSRVGKIVFIPESAPEPPKTVSPQYFGGVPEILLGSLHGAALGWA